MKFFEDIKLQSLKDDQIVCGDIFLCERTLDSTVFVLCDGIGSGVYANIAAITCANRLLELMRKGVSFLAACDTVAESMHQARKGEFPYSAFSIAKILKDGHYTVYTFESPSPILIKDGIAYALQPVFHSTGQEEIGESSGLLNIGDSLILLSDGIIQAGIGRGYAPGVGESKVAEFVNYHLKHNCDIYEIPGEIMKMSLDNSGGRCEDDLSIAVLYCREAMQLAVLTGPPSSRSKDGEFVKRFVSLPGTHIICGSSTADIAARELHKKMVEVSGPAWYGAVPEYVIEGVDMVTEGALVLNQVYNILGENPDQLTGSSVAERVCAHMHQADVITFLIGNALNTAHSSLAFKQIGVQPRHLIVRHIAEKLKLMGKLVVEEHY